MGKGRKRNDFETTLVVEEVEKTLYSIVTSYFELPLNKIGK